MLGTGLLGVISAVGCSDQTSPIAPASKAGGGIVASVEAPADGNGTKEVITLSGDAPDPFTCPNGEELILHVEGWIQLRFFPEPNNPHVELDNFHVVHTWSNSAGDTFVDQEILAEHYYFDRTTGDLILAFTGKLSFLGIVGRLVIDLDTDEVLFVTGPGFPDHLARACAALT
jgi:hypothetical protein